MLLSSLTAAAALLLGADITSSNTITSNTSAWQTISNKDGVHLEQRPFAGSSYFEYRVRRDTDLTVGALCDNTYEWGSRGTDHDELRGRRVLEDRGDTRVVYDQIATPALVPPRDFAFTVKRELQGNSCRITFVTANDKAPPLQRGWVRMPEVHGFWLFEPRNSAGSHLTYVLYSDPGPGVPTHFVHGPQRDAAVKNVEKAIRLSRGAMTGARRP